MIKSNLNFSSVVNNENLVPITTLEVIKKLEDPSKILVAEIDPEYSGGFELCERYQIDSRYGINCLVAEAKRNNIKTYCALLVPVGYKYNMSSVVRKQLNARMVSVAPLDYVIEQTKMEFGSITPIGLPNEWHIFIDPLTLKEEYIIIGGGFKTSKLMIPSKLLLQLPNAMILEGLAKENN